MIQGEYTFSCTVTDPYGFESYLEKDVKVGAEPNNNPEVYIGYNTLGGESLKEFMKTKTQVEKSAAKK